MADNPAVSPGKWRIIVDEDTWKAAQQAATRTRAADDAFVAGRDLTVVNLPQAPVPDDPRHRVFVVHGRNEPARSAMFTFLRAIGLAPIEWSEAVKTTGEASPYIGDVLDAAFGAAQAIVVLLTPDDIAYLRPEYANGNDDREIEPQAQARPNVLFEAGMALGRDAKRTVLVELGQLRAFSDVAGRLAVRISDSPAERKDLAQRLESAGCSINLTGNDWLTAGDFSAPPPPGGGLPLGKRVPSPSTTSGVRMDARFHYRKSGSQLVIINNGPEVIYDLDIELPDNLQGFRIVDPGFPIAKLPAGKTLTLLCSLTMPRNFTFFDLTITGRTAAGESVRQEVFIDLGV